MKKVLANRILLFIISVIIALAVFLINPFQLSVAANKVIAVAVLMIFLWISEALPMPVVSLFPMVLFPLFSIAPMDVTAASYSNPVIYLFMGGFMLGLAIEKWNLHRRIALNIVQLTGTSGDKIILGFILATGLISMWLSNTATTMMMFPIALSVISVVKENHPHQKGFQNFALSLMLAIAFASNFGGITTLIGTPPNVAYSAYLQKQYNYNIDFFRWLMVCTPLALLLLLLLYVVMVKWLYPNRMKSDETTRMLIKNEVVILGKFSMAERNVLIIFICTALLWITKDLVNKLGVVKLDDTMIAIMGAISLFICKSGNEGNEPLLGWEDTKRMAWGILLLFGGGIALASALEKAGLIELLGNWFAQFAANKLLIIFLVAFISLFISEVMSNVAQVIVFAPVVSALATAMHMHPLQLGIPMTLAASCASMLPMGTPPNAIVFSSGYIRLNQMTRVGFAMNIISVILITLFSWLVLPFAFQLPI